MEYPIIDMQRTGQHIAELRKQKGMSVQELADRMYLSRLTIYKWQSGRSLPTIDNLLVLGVLLEVRIDEIIVVRKGNEHDRE